MAGALQYQQIPLSNNKDANGKGNKLDTKVSTANSIDKVHEIELHTSNRERSSRVGSPSSSANSSRPSSGGLLRPGSGLRRVGSTVQPLNIVPGDKGSSPVNLPGVYGRAAANSWENNRKTNPS